MFKKKISAFDVEADPKDGFLTKEFFTSLDFEAKTIIDVGIARGTPWLYNAFPKASFVLVDPIPGFEDNLFKPPKKHVCVNVGLGRTPGTMQLDLRGPRSSLHAWKTDKGADSQGIVDVPIKTLDALISEQCPDGPLGLKIDTEGHEVEVLAGLDAQREQIEFIVCEASIRKRFEDDYNFSDLVEIAAEKGFELYNFVSSHKPRPVHYDCLFLKRGDKRFGLGDF